MIQILDIVGALIVLFAIASRFKRPWLWALYGVGCLVYLYINACYRIWGQVAINVVGSALAFYNYYAERRKLQRAYSAPPPKPCPR